METRVVKAPNPKSPYWYVEFTAPDGTRRRVSTGRKLRREAKEHAGQVAHDWIEKHTPKPTPKGETSLEDFWTYYRANIAGLRPLTLAANERVWNRFAKTHARRTLGSIRKTDATVYRNILAKDLSARTVNTQVNRLAGMFTFAIDNGIIDGPNPFRGIKRIKETDAPPKGLEPEQLERLLREAKLHSWTVYLYVALGAYAGLRKGECIAARFEWIDWDNELIRVQSGNGFDTKSGKDRTVPLHSRLKEILIEYADLLGTRSGYIIAPEKTEKGKYMYRYSPDDSFHIVATRADMPEWFTHHVLRHTFAYQLGDAGVSPVKLQRWLGHSTINTTMIYVKLRDKYDADIERIGG